MKYLLALILTLTVISCGSKARQAQQTNVTQMTLFCTTKSGEFTQYVYTYSDGINRVFVLTDYNGKAVAITK